MKLDIRNHSSMTGIEEIAEKLYKFAQKQLGFDQPARVVFESQGDRAVDIFSPTGNYNPETRTVKIFVDHRHPKDILRSMAHELIHHAQCCQGAFDAPIDTSPGYAQKDDRMRDLERDAYFWGNGILFRDWEDNHKQRSTWNLMNENKRQITDEQKLRQKVRRMIMESLQEQAGMNDPLTSPGPDMVWGPSHPRGGTPVTTPGDEPEPYVSDPLAHELSVDPGPESQDPMERYEEQGLLDRWIDYFVGGGPTAHPDPTEGAVIPEGAPVYQRDDDGKELEEQKPLKEDSVSAEEAEVAIAREQPNLTAAQLKAIHTGGASAVQTGPEGSERALSRGGRPAGRAGGYPTKENQEKPLEEWYNDTLHEALLKKFKIKK